MNYTLRSMGSDSVLLLFILLPKLFQLWQLGALSGRFWGPFDRPRPPFEHSSLAPQDTPGSCFPCLGPRINRFSKNKQTNKQKPPCKTSSKIN